MTEFVITAALIFIVVGWLCFEAAIIDRVLKLLNALPAIKFLISATYRKEKWHDWKRVKTSYAIYEVMSMLLSLLIVGSVLALLFYSIA